MHYSQRTRVMLDKPRYRRMLDLFCGEWGIGKVFAERSWIVTGIDLKKPSYIPPGCTFEQRDILSIGRGWDWERYAKGFDFIWASSSCEEFSRWGMRCFFPNPPYPGLGIRLFNHARELCETSGLPYVMENVRAAQEFVGSAKGHCGPFYLWGNAVPPIVPQGVIKGMTRKALGHYDYCGRTRLEHKERTR
jgi:hypothetical protein